MKSRSILALTASLVLGGVVPAAALEPVAPPSTSGPPITCPNPNGGACLGPLEAGTYRTTSFLTPFTFTAPEGWANYQDHPWGVLLVAPGGTLAGVDAGVSDYIHILQGIGVHAPDGPCGVAEDGVGLDPASMAAALQAHEGILVSDPVPVEVGGLTGLMLDIGDDPFADVGCTDPSVTAPIKAFIIGVGPVPAGLVHGEGQGISTRLYLLGLPDGNIVIEVSDVVDNPGNADDYQSVIDSIEFATPD